MIILDVESEGVRHVLFLIVTKIWRTSMTSTILFQTSDQIKNDDGTIVVATIFIHLNVLHTNLVIKNLFP